MPIKGVGKRENIACPLRDVARQKQSLNHAHADRALEVEHVSLPSS